MLDIRSKKEKTLFKKLLITPLVFVILFGLSSCTLKTLENKTFIFKSLIVIEGDLDDLVPEKIENLEKQFQSIKYTFKEEVVHVHYEYDGESYDYEYPYTFIDGELKIMDFPNLVHYIKKNKIYCEGYMDSYKYRIILKEE